MNEIGVVPPWEAEAAFPQKPAGSEFGYAVGRRLVTCTREELIRKCAAPGTAIASLVWTPESPRLVTPGEVAYLQESVRKRKAANLHQRTLLAAFSCFIWGALALTQKKSHEWPLYLAVAFFAGLVPFVLAIRAANRLASSKAGEGPDAVKTARFIAWVRRRPKKISWVLAGGIMLAGIWQLAVGLERSIDLAGHVKQLVFHGEPWRLLSAGFLHTGWIHFALNLSALIVLCAMVEALTSRFHLAVIFLVSLIAGSMASQFLNPGPTSVGSSGAIVGVLGFLTVFAFRKRGELPATFLKSIVFMVISVVALGVMAYGLLDNSAHVGGFAGGALLGWLLLPGRELKIPVEAGSGLRAVGWVSLAILLAGVGAMPLYARSRGMFDALMSGAASLGDEGRFDQAVEVYTRALKLRPEEASGYWGRGYAHYKKDDLMAALSDDNEALRIDPRLAPVYHNRSIVRRRLGDLNRALADLDAALRLNPKSAHSYEERATVRQELGNLEGAVEDADHALEIAPRNGAMLIWRAWFHILLGHHDLALKDCEAALAINSEDAYAINTRGLARFGKGDVDEAIQDYSEAIRRDARHPFAYANRGEAKLAKKDLDGALADFEQALKVNGRDPEGFLGRGLVRRERGDTVGARADFETALRMANRGWNRRAYTEGVLRDLDKKD